MSIGKEKELTLKSLTNDSYARHLADARQYEIEGNLFGAAVAYESAATFVKEGNIENPDALPSALKSYFLFLECANEAKENGATYFAARCKGAAERVAKDNTLYGLGAG